MSNVKGNAVNGLKWSALERIISQGAQLVIMLFLAKMLGPHAFGLIGMLSIFITLGQVFVDSGFSSAIIRKVDRNRNDLSTAFYYNLVMSIVIYGLYFFISPLVATFYNQHELSNLLKVLGLTLVTNAFAVIPRTILSIRMDFKSQAKASIVSVFLSGLIALGLAFIGYGVWALVIQSLSYSILNSFFLNFITKWKPDLIFDRKSFIYLFGFGNKLLLSGLLDAGYNNIYQIIIGKKYDAFNVGQYTQANQLSSIPAITLTNVIQRVTYPLFSHMQDDNQKLGKSYLLTLKIAAIIIFPIMSGLAVISKPFLALFLGAEWGYSSELITILALAYMLYPIHALNLNILQVVGRSDIFLKVEIIKKILGLGIVIFTSQFTIYQMVIGLLVHSYVSLGLNMYYSGRLIGLTVFKQIKEIAPFWITAILTCFTAGTIARYITNELGLQILIILVISVVSYITITFNLNKTLIKYIISSLMKNKEISQ